MEIYNSKEWFKAVFYLHRSDTVRKLFPYLILATILSLAVAYYELEYLNLSEKSWVRNITVVHSLLGFALSLLLVFRTNTAYDRWWEARKQWGTLVNISRSFAIKINAMVAEDDHRRRSFFKEAIPLYALSLFHHLRSDYTTYMLDEVEHPELSMDTQKHGPNQVASMMFRNVQDMFKSGEITPEEYRILDHEIRTFTDVCGACERIKNTPIPRSYSAFLKKFIVVYVASLPVGYVFSIGYFVAAAVPFIFYVLASLELIAESIEEPFGIDSDDLPIEKIASNIKRHVGEIIL
ncbi:bestrophin family protein [Jiulongibacter sediminis]|jgi:putative membrane protein|uniref:bestrophin family protein n=1 Tax=Jiulongibacter sediminis TaxID=1605367 RepID=UPI0026EE48EC|nr:bestrophin family ion channel [Jiulongibacter sediminis]